MMYSEYLFPDGSERFLLASASSTADVDPDEMIPLTIRLKPSADLLEAANALVRMPLRERPYMSLEELEERFFSSQEDINAVLDFVTNKKLQVMRDGISRQAIKVLAPARRSQDLFGTDLKIYKLPDGTSYRGREGRISLGSDTISIRAASAIRGVFGLDNRRQAEPFVTFKVSEATDAYMRWPADYSWPVGMDGDSQCVGVLSFGASLTAQQVALALGINIADEQVVTLAGVEAGSVPESETALDLAILSNRVPKVRLALYFAPPTERGWVDALDAVIQDRINRPSVISISWGYPERNGSDQLWTPNAIYAVQESLAAAALLGITVCAASGDYGAQMDKYGARVVFPASSTFALACGGTMLVDGIEKVWNNGKCASGGGVSDVIARQPWQPEPTLNHTPLRKDAPLDGRLLPDVASLADKVTVMVNGYPLKDAEGTSAAAPLWAALVVCANQNLKRNGSAKTAGPITPLLYSSSGPFTNVFNDIRHGCNAIPPTAAGYGYCAGFGWDACTGWGSPKGQQFVDAVESSAAIG